MVVFLLSLGGIPPTAGFIGKYYLFAAAVKSGYGWLAIIAVLMSAVSMFYYFRLVVAMYLKEEREAEIALSWPLQATIVACLVGTLLLGILPEQALREVKRSAATVIAAVK
jgi:NADH-quinone oxidoreductase subunit N